MSESPSTAFPAGDPGELFSDMAQQIFGPAAPSGDPYTANPMPAMTMQGFTANYAATKPEADCGDCMTYFTPAQVPVSAFLAHNFAVCDQWFASVPCQTFTNRMFAVCAAPAISRTAFTHDPFSLVNDLQYVLANSVEVTPPAAEYVDLPSVFQALDAAYPQAEPSGPPNWKVYFFDYSIAAMIVPYVYRAAIGEDNVNVATYDNSDWPVGAVPHPAIIGSRLGAVRARLSTIWLTEPYPNSLSSSRAIRRTWPIHRFRRIATILETPLFCLTSCPAPTTRSTSPTARRSLPKSTMRFVIVRTGIAAC